MTMWEPEDEAEWRRKMSDTPMTEIDMHDSDCATHNMPAMPNGSCDCQLKKPTFWIIEEGYNDMMAVDRVGGDAPRYVGLDDYERLERENEALRKDAERINWIEKKIKEVASVWFCPCGEELRFVQVRHFGGDVDNHPTVPGLRAAIDAAIDAAIKEQSNGY